MFLSWVCTVLLTFSLFLYFFHKIFRCRNIDSPPTAPTASVFAFVRNRDRLLEWLTELLLSTSSHTVKIAGVPGGRIPGIVTSNPANVEYILKTNFDNYSKGERFRFLLHDFLGRGIFNTDGELWKIQRKAASYEFNTKSLRNFVVETVQWEIRNRLMVVLQNACERGEPVDLQDILQRFAFDNICNVAFGVDPGCLHPSMPSPRFAEAFDCASKITYKRFLAVAPELMVKIKRLLNIGSERRLREALRVVNEFALGVIRSRREDIEKKGEPGREDILSRFMAAVIKNRTRFDDEDEQTSNMNEKSDMLLKDMVVSIMLAGKDTTSTALAWFFWLLSSHPRVEEAIRQEILGVLAKRGVDKEEKGELTHAALFSYEELKCMAYLHGALSESLRLYPPLPLDSKIASNDDVLPDGTTVSTGSFVAYNIYAMGRMEGIWGKDFMEFRPERWLNIDGSFEMKNPFKFAVFNAGPRSCLGMDMALIQMKSIVASLLHSFTLKMDDNYCPQYSLIITLRMKDGLSVTVTSRH